MKDVVKELKKAGIVPIFADGAVKLPSLPPLLDAAEGAARPGRENARAWFVYNAEDPSNFDTYLDAEPLQAPYVNWHESVTQLLALEEEKGPFDGVLGFSQGAVAAHILLATQPLRAPVKYGICMSGFAAKMPLLPGRAAAAAAAATANQSSEEGGITTSDILEAVAALGDVAPEAAAAYARGFRAARKAGGTPTAAVVGSAVSSISVPSLHVSGKADTEVPPHHQAELAACFANPTVFEHDKGHVAGLGPKAVRTAFVAKVAELAASCR